MAGIVGVWYWLATPTVLVGGTDYTVDGAWTDIDLTSATSANAKFVIIELYLGTGGTAADLFAVRKNGETPAAKPSLYCQVTGKAITDLVFCAIDSGQILEYYATDASDTQIWVLGYIE